jgi:hypothetical protein
LKKINLDLLEFFTTHYKPGVIGMVGTNDNIGRAIRRGQRRMHDGQPSYWSHCFIMGRKRLDFRCTTETPVESIYIFESDIKLNIEHMQIRNGAQENWLGKWCETKVEHAAVIDFGLDLFQEQIVLASALQMISDDVMYPVGGLFHTWLAIQLHKFGFKNPLAGLHALFCSSYARRCYMAAKADFLAPDVDLWNTSPEHIAQAGKDKMILWK